jgi:hypothetical protein
MTKKEILDTVKQLTFVPEKALFVPHANEPLFCKVGLGTYTDGKQDLFSYKIDLVDFVALDGFQISAENIGWLKNEKILQITK